MNKLVWFFGCSASGKESLIKYIYNNIDNKLNDQLNIELDKTIILKKSLDYISKKSDDSITKKRIEIIYDIIELCEIKNDLTVLIKGQNSDIRNNFIEILKRKVTNATNEIVYVTANKKILIERVKTKSWYDISRGDDDFISSIDRSLEYMKKFKDEKITYIDSKPNYNYEIISKEKVKTLRGI